MKKVAFLFIAATLIVAVAGCTTTGTPTPRPTDTTPCAIPTQSPPTGTPAPTPWLTGYAEHVKGGMQRLVNQVECTIEAVYYNNDMSMPHALRTTSGNAHHGVIYRLRFANPTGASQTFVAGDSLKSTIQYFIGGTRGYLPTSDFFYDPATNKEYGEVKLANGESKELYMLAYITNDSAYDTYGSAIDTISLDLNPHYFEQPQ